MKLRQTDKQARLNREDPTLLLNEVPYGRVPYEQRTKYGHMEQTTSIDLSTTVAATCRLTDQTVWIVVKDHHKDAVHMNQN